MRSSLATLHGLFRPGLGAGVRILGGIIVVAVLVGRAPPRPAVPQAPRQPAPPRHVWLSVAVVAGDPERPRLLDLETGAVTTLAYPGAGRLDQIACSPWRDGAGRFHLVGCWHDRPGRRGSGLDQPSGLARWTFPPAPVVDRVGLAIAPVEPPCWSPDRSDRVVFVAGDRQLYVYDFPEGRGTRGRGPDPAPPRPLRWEIDPPGVGTVMVRGFCWPGAPALGGRLLVALLWQPAGVQTRLSSHLWWLELSRDAGSIVGAERAIVAEGDDARWAQIEESKPGVGVGRDGAPLLAFLAREWGQVDWELWVMPIAPAAAGRGPRVQVALGRRLAEGCAAAVTPAFSPDGRWVYASRAVDGWARLQRFALAGATGPDGEALGPPAAGRGTPLRPSLAYEAVDVFTNRSQSGRDDRAAP
jgi:hypothetical protein